MAKTFLAFWGELGGNEMEQSAVLRRTRGCGSMFMRFRAISHLGLSLVLMAFLDNSGRAQQTQPTEYQLKAAFLFNFAKFVEWPAPAFASNNSPLIIGVLGDNPFRDDLARMIQNKLIDDHPLKVVEFKDFHAATGLTNCHILFICSSEKDRLPEIFESLRGSAALTIGESANFAESGGMIQFFMEQTKIRFQINQDAATKSKLKISSKLMSLSTKPGG